MSRDTGTGGTFERQTAAVLDRCGIHYFSQVEVGEKPGGGKHRVDHVVHRPDGTKILVSCKAQHTGGTAEEKLPYELMKLAHTVTDSHAQWGDYAVLILDGSGWSAGIKKMLEEDAWLWLEEARKRVRVYYSAEEFVRAEFPDSYVHKEPQV